MTIHPHQWQIWQRCELAWAEWLANQGYAVVLQMDLLNNTPLTKAPVTILPRGQGVAVAPDIRASRDGQSVLWEVKSRRRADIHPETGHAQHWMPLRNYQDYRKTQHDEGFVVKVALYEHGDAVNDGQWYTTTLDAIHRHGRRGSKTFADGTSQTVVYWPVDIMERCDGPDINQVAQPTLAIQHEPIIDDTDPELVNETLIDHELDGDGVTTLVDIERQTRQPSPTPLPAGQQLQFNVVASNPWHGLEVLAKQLGLTHVPRYSVLYATSESLTVPDMDTVFGLCHYGIRVFVYSTHNPFGDDIPTMYRAFLEARFVEWSINPDMPTIAPYWEVDGVAHAGHNEPLKSEAGRYAGPPGFEGINIHQYRVVHAPAAHDVLVSAGAGTGKTETMAERLMYLLSVPRSGAPLQMKEVSLITFTREAAREMRSRIARTIMLRQRLASRYVHPAVVWLMQLGQAQIVTIHAFAKRIIQQNGALLGINPLFKVGQLNHEWKRIVEAELAQRLEPFGPNRTDMPQVQQWHKIIKRIWDTLENNGVPMIQLHQAEVDALSAHMSWHFTESQDYQSEEVVVDIVHQIVEQTRVRFQHECMKYQTIPTNQLIQTAVYVLEQLHAYNLPIKQPLRYIFIDEFQDTDGVQMDLLVRMRLLFESRLCIVGDAKQGIYRFRGAEGNAFEVVQKRMQDKNLPKFDHYALVRNFRSDGKLLDSFHTYFVQWNTHKWLNYNRTQDDEDRLESRISKKDVGEALTREFVAFRQHKTEEVNAENSLDDDIEHKTVTQIKTWRREHPDASIAILTRTNNGALRFHRALRKHGIACELRVGGQFFQTPAVRELRVLLEAVLTPSDDAAILELLDTRWGVGMSWERKKDIDFIDDNSIWQQKPPTVYDWTSRFAHLATHRSFYREDIEHYRDRVMSLASMLHKMSAISFIVQCQNILRPERNDVQISSVDSTQSDEERTRIYDVERQRYHRCLTYLLTLIDDAFGTSQTSLRQILEWLRIQIATNFDVDEPFDDDEHAHSNAGTITAITVHKSKGLEYDFVLIPQTTVSFTRDRERTDYHVVIDPRYTDTRLVVWHWSTPIYVNKKLYFSNTTRNDRIWDNDQAEVIKEETRLLYVAMTRARKKLVYYRPTNLYKLTDQIKRANKSGNTLFTPQVESWAELLAIGEGILQGDAHA